jgi:O-Antigen ligase
MSRAQTRCPLHRYAILGAFGAVAVGALFSMMGPLKAIIIATGIVMMIGMIEWPIIGLFMVIMCATCLQVYGDGNLTGLPISGGKLFGVLTFGMWLMKVARDRAPLTYSPQMKALIWYVAAMTLVALLVHPSEPSDENGFMRFLQVGLVYWLVANIAGVDRRSLLFTCGAVTLGLALCSVIGTLEHFVPSFSIEFDDPALQAGAVGAIIDRDSLEGVELRRITGGLGDSNWLAVTLATILPLNIFWWRMARGWMTRCLSLAAAGLQALALVLSYTRSGFLGLFVAVIYLTWRRVIPVSTIFKGGAIVVLVGLIWLPPGFMERVLSLNYLQNGSTPMREDLTGTALQFALEHPILGYGYGQFGVKFIETINTNVSSRIGAWGFELARAIEDGREEKHNIGAHNLYLEIMVEYGLVGLVPFVAFMLLAIADCRVATPRTDPELELLGLCLAAGLISFMVCGMFVHAKYLKILWIVAGLAAAYRRVAVTEGWASLRKVRPMARVSVAGGTSGAPDTTGASGARA